MTYEEDPIPALSIGVSVGGTGGDARRWGDAAMDVARRVKELRDGVNSPLRLNVVYHVPGEVVPVDFVGVRTGTFSRSERLLMIQAAVPTEFPLEGEAALIELLQAALDLAEEFGRDKRVLAEGDFAPVRQIVKDIQDQLLDKRESD